MNRMLAKVAPLVKLNIVFKPTVRLNILSKLKSVIPTLNHSNVVYKINCQDCNEFYIGLTTRRLQSIVLYINILRQVIILIVNIQKLLAMTK